MSIATLRRALIFVALASAARAGSGCDEAGMWTPRNPGTVSARVRDTNGLPVAGARVMVEIPNSVGGVFQTGTLSDASGTVTVRGVPEGSRPVEVTPPSGFSIDPDRRIQVVDVREGRTTKVTFVLTRVQ